MWKYVSRRIRDTLERSVNHLDKRGTTGVVNSACHSNAPEESNPDNCAPCHSSGSGTKSNGWNFEQLNRTWIGAITWSSAVVVGWYTSQLIHLKIKHCSKKYQIGCPNINNLISSLHPYISEINKKPVCMNSGPTVEKIINSFAPTVHLISNDNVGPNTGESSVTTSPDSSDNDIGEVLNSIENRLGLAAIENGQHKDGLNLLRSAANRNHAPALYNLGLCYEMGLGVPIDEKSAMELYKSAAALHHPGALYNLGIYYGQGRGGLARDPNIAIRLLKLAAVQGQEDAIKALDSLGDDSTQNLSPTPHNSLDPWSIPYSPYFQSGSIVPSPTTLFVENINYLQGKNCGTVF